MHELEGLPLSDLGKRLFVIRKNGTVVEILEGKKPGITPKQLDEAKRWCFEGDTRWVPMGSRYPPGINPVPWTCGFFFCHDRFKRPCPWWIDGNHRVWCDRSRDKVHPGKPIYRGSADDPPMVDLLAQTIALRPVRLRSGIEAIPCET
jgi:hypothetical protein